MEKLLFSRRQKQEAPQKLNNLSPEKYGKGAYCELTFTPSKLADNVIFREASNLKRIQEQSSKCRQLQASNQVLGDQVIYLKKERDGISDSLNQIIDMYKKIISDMETKSEDRLKDAQKKFKDQIQRFIKDKEEEAKYFQSEKQILEERLQQLENQLTDLKEELEQVHKHKGNTEAEIQKLQIQYKNVSQKLRQTEQKAKIDEERAKQEFDSLKKEFMHAEVEWKNTFNEEMHKKERQIETNARTFKAQLDKLQTQRNSQMLMKNQQLKDLMKAFETESKRLNQIISVKDKLIDTLSTQNNKQKTRILNLTRDYQTQINHLTHQKNRLIDQIEHLGRQNETLARDKALITGDLQCDNTNLRDLLLQSSVELDRCKNQFLTLAKQNSQLLVRLKGAEEEAKTWRDSYYLNKTRN